MPRPAAGAIKNRVSNSHPNSGSQVKNGNAAITGSTISATGSNNASNRGITGSVNGGRTRTGAATTSVSPALQTTMTSRPTTYAYGTGNNTRYYRATGYGRGYRNRYYGSSGNYGRSQSNDRSLVARLHSVHSTLVRIDHDYQGHRARAAHQVSLAIRHLSHRSIYGYTSAVGGLSGQSNLRLTGLNGTGNGNLNGNGTRRQTGVNGNGQRNRLSQAQSDALMGQALRTTQGITSQLSHQGQYHSSHRLAYLRLQRAMHEMNAALSVR
jgi:hypothetical protein